MSYIGTSGAGFVSAGRDGKIYIKALGEDKLEMPLNLFKTYKFGEEYQISRVAYENGTESFKFGDETRNTLWLNQDNLFIVDEKQVENIYNKLKGLTINSFEGTALIDPRIDMGDILVIGEKPVIYQGQMNFCGRFIADIKSKISIKQRQETTVKRQSQTAIRRKLQSRIDEANGKIIQLVEEQTETSNKLSQHEQTIDQIQDTVKSTTEELKEEIKQASDDINNNLTENYWTKTEASSQITQTAEGVKSEVNKTITEAKQEAIDSANSSTDSKLEEYTTKVQSLIEQEGDSILASVKGDYATKTELGETKTSLQASIELKLNKTDVVSEINASADVIRLKAAGRLILEAGNFQLDASGNITATGGKIGGFNLSSTEFIGSLNGIYNYNIYDARAIMMSQLDTLYVSNNLKDIFDANEDNNISSADVLRILNILNGMTTNTKSLSGTIKINSKDPKNAISIIKNNEICVSLGVGGVNTNLLTTENVLCGYSFNNESNSFRGIALNGETAKISIVANGSVGTTIDHESIFSRNIMTEKISTIDDKTIVDIGAINTYFGTDSSHSGITNSLRGNNVRLYCHDGGGVYLGYSGSTAITSDEKLKDIYEIDNRYIEFFKNLKPITYIYKDRGHRNHLGFGARQVEEALTKAGLTTEEFAGVLIDKDVTISADEAGTDKDVHYDELYSLRYEEFITLNTLMIQKILEKLEGVK